MELTAEIDSLTERATLLASVDYATVAGADAARLLGSCSRLQRVISSVCTQLAGRVEATSAHVAHGERDAAGFVARVCGVDRPTASSQLALARQLPELSVANAAFCAGQLSSQQAAAVVRAGQADPSSQEELVGLAQTCSSTTLAKRAKAIESSRSVAGDLRRRDAQRQARRCHLSTTEDGMVQLYARLVPEDGAIVDNVLRCHREAIFRDAHRSGRQPSSGQRNADALISIFQLAAGHRQGTCAEPPISAACGGGDGSPSSTAGAGSGVAGGTAGTSAAGAGAIGTRRPRRARPKAQVSVVIDHGALVRGFREPGERCEIPGVGEVSVAFVREVLGDSLLRFLVVKGRDVTTVTSRTRYVPAEVRAGLDLRDGGCQVPGCITGLRLERDHVVDFARGGPTNLENLQLLCSWHHRLKTRDGYRLEGPPGDRRWIGPDGQEVGAGLWGAEPSGASSDGLARARDGRGEQDAWSSQDATRERAGDGGARDGRALTDGEASRGPAGDGGGDVAPAVGPGNVGGSSRREARARDGSRTGTGDIEAGPPSQQPQEMTLFEPP